jgi:transcriptional regulator with XRE-family HTH domain
MTASQSPHGTLIVDGVTPSEMQKRIARRLRNRFRIAKLTTIQIAAQMGVPRTRVSDWLNGNSLLGPIHAARIAQILDCSPAWLLFGVGPPRLGSTNAKDEGPLPEDRYDDEPSGRLLWVTEFLRREAERSRVESLAAGARPPQAALSGQRTQQGDHR